MNSNRAFDTTAIVLSALLGISWFITTAKLVEHAGEEAHGDASMGQALNAIMSFVFVCVTWLFLGGLLLKTQDAMPAWASLVAMLLYFFAGASSLVSVGLVSTPKVVWPIVVPIAVPILLAGYAISLCQPSLHSKLSTIPPGAAILGVVLILAILPWPPLMRSMNEKEERRAARANETRKLQEESKISQHQQNLDRIAAMPADSHIWDWFDLISDKSGVRTEALAALSKNPNRQSDMEQMLPQSIPPMAYAADLELSLTPKLCAAAQTWLTHAASEARRTPDGRPSYFEEQDYLAPAIPGLRWFHEHGCAMDPGLAALEAAVETFRDTPLRAQLLAELKAMRTK